MSQAAYNQLYEGPEFCTPTKCVTIRPPLNPKVRFVHKGMYQIIKHFAIAHFVQVCRHAARGMLSISICEHRAFPRTTSHVHVDFVVLGVQGYAPTSCQTPEPGDDSGGAPGGRLCPFY